MPSLEDEYRQHNFVGNTATLVTHDTDSNIPRYTRFSLVFSHNDES